MGRRMHNSDKLFGQWCKENGFGDMDRRYRTAALWFAQVTRDGSVEWPEGISDPKNLHQWFTEQKQTALLPADLSDIQAETIELDERSAENVAKLSRRAKAGDEGSAIAQRHIEALAKKHNTTVPRRHPLRLGSHPAGQGL